MPNLRSIFSFLTFFLFLAFLPFPCATAAAWTQEAYVWQRQPTPALDAALQNSSPYLTAYCFLAAEVSWDKKAAAPQITRVPLDYAKLAAFSHTSGKPISLALRIATVSTKNQFTTLQPQLAALAKELLATARAAGLSTAELQIDFDCPESKLELYSKWLADIRVACSPTPIAFTALPAWLKNETAFSNLCNESGVHGPFILQVHSLDKPASMDDSVSLCDSRSALDYAAIANETAARANTRFRIALPTYGYTLGFAPDSHFIGIAAETPRDWPANTQLRTLRADPFEMQSLAQKLTAQKLTNLSGIIWFRLPTTDNRLAWPLETFSAVVQNKPIVSQLTAEVHRTQPGLAEIVIINRGQTTEPLPQNVHVAWSAGFKPTSSDGLVGYDFWCDNTDCTAFVGTRKNLSPVELAPGRSRVIGWLRFDFSDATAAANFSIHATIP